MATVQPCNTSENDSGGSFISLISSKIPITTARAKSSGVERILRVISTPSFLKKAISVKVPPISADILREPDTTNLFKENFW